MSQTSFMAIAFIAQAEIAAIPHIQTTVSSIIGALHYIVLAIAPSILL